MGSLVPGWETKPEPDFRERGAPRILLSPALPIRKLRFALTRAATCQRARQAFRCPSHPTLLSNCYICVILVLNHALWRSVLGERAVRAASSQPLLWGLRAPPRFL